MSEALARLVKVRDRQSRDKLRESAARKRGRPSVNLPTSTEEEGALKKLQAEAKAKGVKLHNGGRGGLPSSLVLHVMRRDGYRCKKCGRRDFPLGPHHKGGIPDSEWLKKKGHKNEPDNLATVCDKCHDEVHEEARADGKA
jgi:hypothetical protein